MQARSPNRPQTSLRRPMAARRPAPVTETCHWECAWWATLAADHFDGELADRRTGDLLTWTAQAGVRIGDVYLLATTAPDRRLRAWGWVVGAPHGDDEQGWQVTVRFGGRLGDPLRLKDLREDPALAAWSPLARVTAGRLEGIPPAVWQMLRRHVQAQVAVAKPVPQAETAVPSETDPTAAAPATERPARQGRSGRQPERRPAEEAQPAWPWDGLSRGPFFRELVQRVLLPQGFTLIELFGRRNPQGIDMVAHRPQVRWTRWVAQLDVTGEAVDVASVQEVVEGRAYFGAQAALLIATGPVTEAARALAREQQVEIWDAAWLRSVWLRSTDGPAVGEAGAERDAGYDRRTAVAI